MGELDLTRRIRPPDQVYLAALAGLLLGPQRARIRVVYVSEECAERLSRMRPDQSGPTVDQVSTVRGMPTLESLIHDLWPELVTG